MQKSDLYQNKLKLHHIIVAYLNYHKMNCKFIFEILNDSNAVISISDNSPAEKGRKALKPRLMATKCAWIYEYLQPDVLDVEEVKLALMLEYFPDSGNAARITVHSKTNSTSFEENYSELFGYPCLPTSCNLLQLLIRLPRV